MKQQIARLSPHQNAKVASIVWAVTSLLFVVPMFLVSWLTIPPQARGHNGFFDYFFLIMPFAYLILGYIVAVFGCWVYNSLFKFIGGFEFESRDQQA
ncbi:MAG TPA: hypothetical protein VMI74_03930 [Burkholderiales bacterium]|nr:hypothetical protein [Burkholderiales bacterium]